MREVARPSEFRPAVAIIGVGLGAGAAAYALPGMLLGFLGNFVYRNLNGNFVYLIYAVGLLAPILALLSLFLVRLAYRFRYQLLAFYSLGLWAVYELVARTSGADGALLVSSAALIGLYLLAAAASFYPPSTKGAGKSLS